MKKAILFGATGFIGSHLLNDLLSSPDYAQVTVVVRRPLSLAHPKLKVLIGDFRSLESLKDEIRADEVFITLGTTKKHTPDPKEYYHIDHDYPVLAAKIAKANGAKSVFVVTAIGANANSKFFYIKTKGETEADIKSLGFEHTHIFRPSMILGHRQEKRALEKTFVTVSRVINPMLAGGFDRYRGIDGKDVAKAMMNAAKKQTGKVNVYRWREMTALL